MTPVSIELLQAEAAKAPKPAAITPPPSNGNGHAHHNGNGHSNGDRTAFNRCRSYVAKMPPSVQGQNGSKSLLEVACTTFRFGLPRSEARLIVDGYNSISCQPRWDDSELDHKLDDAEKKVTAAGEFGKLATTHDSNGHAQNGHAANGHQSATNEGGQAAASSERPGDSLIEIPEPVSLEQLIESYPEMMPPTIHGISRTSEVVNVIASPKFGKSWLTYLIALCFATGMRLFGKFLTVVGNVLIIDNELHANTFAHRLPLVARKLEIEPREYAGRIDVMSLRGKLADIHRIASRLMQFEPGKYSAIIIDALYRTYPEGFDENSNADMTALYNTLDSVAAHLNCTIFVVHHSSKGNQSLKSITDTGSGAGAISRAADSHLILRPHAEDGVAVLEAAVRSWPPVDPICLRWDFPVWRLDETHDPKALKPERRQAAKSDDDKPIRLNRNIEKVLAALRSEGPMTKTSLSRAAKVNGAGTNEAIQALLESGEVEECPVETKRGKFDGFCAVEPDPRQPQTATPDSPDSQTSLPLTRQLPFRELSCQVSGVDGQKPEGGKLSGVEF